MPCGAAGSPPRKGSGPADIVAKDGLLLLLELRGAPGGFALVPRRLSFETMFGKDTNIEHHQNLPIRMFYYLLSGAGS